MLALFGACMEAFGGSDFFSALDLSGFVVAAFSSATVGGGGVWFVSVAAVVESLFGVVETDVAGPLSAVGTLTVIGALPGTDVAEGFGCCVETK